LERQKSPKLKKGGFGKKKEEALKGKGQRNLRKGVSLSNKGNF